MKKLVCLFFLALAASLSAQVNKGGVITVQGHPHEHLTRLHGHKPAPKPAPHLGDIDPGNVRCWVGHLDPKLPASSIDTAYLLVKWIDNLQTPRDSVMFLWGYVWNNVNSYGTAVTKYSLDMLRAVANADCQFLILLQQTGGIGYSVGGIGYNREDRERLQVNFDAGGAQADGRINFHYTELLNCDFGQFEIPYSVEDQANEAIRKATNSSPIGTGIIEHPFNVNYGYPAYDYDYWIGGSYPNILWQAGWFSLYWSFYTGANRQIPGTYSSVGIGERILDNNSVDGFVPNDPNDPSWPPTHGMSGAYRDNPCDCNPCPPRSF